MIILASGSKNRMTALKLAGFPFTSMAADIDEKAIQDPDRKVRQILVAKSKVEKVITNGIVTPPIDIFSDDVPDEDEGHLVVGADGVNIVRGKILEKPQNESEAFDMLKMQSGERCSFLTGFYCFNTKTKKSYQGTSETFYTFREISEHEIHAYIKHEPVLTWAAAFSPSNSRAVSFVTTIEGSYSNFNYSLPFDQLVPIFKKEDII